MVHKTKATGCRKTPIWHKVKGVIRKIKGFKLKSCLDKKR